LPKPEIRFAVLARIRQYGRTSEKLICEVVEFRRGRNKSEMPIRLVFDLKKTISAVAFLAQRDKSLDMFLSLKMLYLADKKALESWGKTITGDKMVSMPKGPVLSTVYNLFKGEGEVENLTEWNSYFGETVNNKITLLKDANIGELSQDEVEALTGARAEVESYAPWSVAEWLHKTCPEWEDPHGSSRPIDPAVILRNSGRREDEIRMIEESTEAFNQIQDLVKSL
jgi:uncharacterized phage-associated protein